MLTIRNRYYQQFDADPGLEVPAEGYGGWKSAELPLEPEHTALVVMHAWDCGTREDYPGWYRAVEYIPRAQAICRDVFPRLLKAVRQSPFQVFHVVGSGQYFQGFPGYQRAKQLAGKPPPELPTVETTDTLELLRQFRRQNVFVGPHNWPDVREGVENLDFAPQARPVGDEGVAENRHQLLALCLHHQVNHLIYIGFALNWCLLLSPAGMAEMSQHGLLCSTIAQAVTAVENKETARGEWSRENALWRVALAYGFVYDLDDFLQAVGGFE